MAEHTEICKLCIHYGTDKGPRSMNGWDYSPTYYEVLSPVKQTVKNVLEIGICGYRDIPGNVVGASLFVWRDFFPNAQVYGIDCDDRFIFNDQPRIHTALANAYYPVELYSTLRKFGVDQYDFIVDDAIHDPAPQVNILLNLWPWLKPGGLYSMEDVCVPKLPNGDLASMISCFPKDSSTRIVHTYKDEKLLLIRKEG